MIICTKKCQPDTSLVDTASFTLPKSDIRDLVRSSASDTVVFVSRRGESRGSNHGATSRTPLDDHALLEDCLGDVDTALLLLQEFQSNGLSRIEKIARFVEAGDLLAVKSAARDLKSRAAALSAHTLCDLAGALENSVGVVRRGCQERLVGQLRDEMNRCLKHIPLVTANAHMDTCET